VTGEQRSKLARVTTATLTTALFKRGFRNTVIQNVHPIDARAGQLVGEAYTLRFIPAREDLSRLDLYADPQYPHRRAFDECPPGHVLVIDSRKDARAASGGDLLLMHLQARGGAGAVSDGGFRDSAAIAKLGFPVYHQRPAPASAPIVHHAVDVDVPIACGDVAVYPGDVIVGDAEAVVVIPAHVAGEVADEAAEMDAYDDFAATKLREGRALQGLYPSTPESRAEFAAWRARGTR
jgi:regulator of RNase E activity RraA